MGHDTFYELSKRSIVINKNVETTFTWDNSYLTVRTDKGIHFINFSYNLESLDKIIDCLETSTTTPKDSPASELFKAKFLKNEMKNADVTEMVLNSALWPHNQHLTQEMTVVSEFVWSPRGFLHNEGILAVLNNIGGIEFLVLQNYKWETLLKFSTYVKKYLIYNKAPKTFKDLKKSVYVVGTWAICWSPNVNSDKSCYFVTAQMSGTILFWSIEHNITKIYVKGKFESASNCEITNIIWIQKTHDKFWLICADLLGQILAYDCQIGKDEIKMIQYHPLWEYKDRMIARNLQYTTINNNILLICSKHRHLLVQVIDENCKVVSQYLNNLNDYRITCITNSLDGFYLATVNCKIFKINVSLTNNVLNVDLQPIEMRDCYSSYDLYSICFSPNNIIFALGMVNRKVLCRKEANKLELIFLSTERKVDMLLPKLLSAKSFTNHWDCIEVLRYKMVKLKTLPQSYLDHLSTASSDINKLKICLIIAIVYNNLKKVMRIGSEVELPYTSVEMIREQILLSKALSLIQLLHNKYQQNNKLNSIEGESFVGARKYLAYYCKKYDKNMCEIIDKCMLSVPTSSYEYICQFCDEKIEGFLCKNDHPNGFCSQSFTPIVGDDYFACKGCGFTVRSELSIENPLCVFCDLHLVNCYTPN